MSEEGAEKNLGKDIGDARLCFRKWMEPRHGKYDLRLANSLLQNFGSRESPGVPARRSGLQKTRPEII
jgi:hypothetical protein